MPSPTSDSPSLPPPEGPGSRQGNADGSNGAQSVPSAESPAEARTELSAFGQGVLARFVIPVLADPGTVPPSTTPAARVPAEERPEVAGEPEACADGVAGREGLREQIDAAIRQAGDSAYGQQPFYDAIANAVMAVRDRRMEQLAAGRETWKTKAAEMEADRDRLATVLEVARRELASKTTVAVPRWEYELMEQQQDRAQEAEAAVDALRLKVADLQRIAAGPQPPEQDSTGWQWLCHRCKHGADGHFTRRSASRAQRKHLAAAHR